MGGYGPLMEQKRLESFSRQEKIEMDTLSMKILSSKLRM
jgi:hypothetical protein